MGAGPHHAEEEQETLEPELSDELKGLGFDPGIPVYEIATVEFSIDDVRRSLFESTYQNPIALPVVTSQDDGGAELWMVVESVRAFYAPNPDNPPFGRYDDPEWYVRGFLAGGGCGEEVVRMHLYIATSHRNVFEHALVQLVRRPSGVAPSTQLKYGSGFSASTPIHPSA